MDRELQENLRRFANDEPMLRAVETYIREFFIRKNGEDIYTMAAEKILLNRLPTVFTMLRGFATGKKETTEKTQIAL